MSPGEIFKLGHLQQTRVALNNHGPRRLQASASYSALECAYKENSISFLFWERLKISMGSTKRVYGPHATESQPDKWWTNLYFVGGINNRDMFMCEKDSREEEKKISRKVFLRCLLVTESSSSRLSSTADFSIHRNYFSFYLYWTKCTKKVLH